MSGIILERAELLMLLDAVQADGVIGLDTNTLRPASQAEHVALIRQGLESLSRRGAVEVVGEVVTINVDLLSMAMLMAHPEAAIVTSRDNPGLGQQLFLHYLAGEVVLEQTLPSEQQHRLALVPGPQGLVERLLGILPVQETPTAAQFRIEISPDDFFDVKQQVESNQFETARARLQQLQWHQVAIDHFLATFAKPDFGGAIALMRCQRDEVVDGRNVAVVQRGEAALWVKQVVPGEPLLEVATIHAAHMRELLAAWLAELEPTAL